MSRFISGVLLPTFDSGGGGGGGGSGTVGPGTVDRLARFSAATTVVDSNLRHDGSGNIQVAVSGKNILPFADGDGSLGTPSMRFEIVAASGGLVTGDVLLHNDKNGAKLRIVEGPGEGELFLLDERTRAVFRFNLHRTELTPDDLSLMIPLEDHQDS